MDGAGGWRPEKWMAFTLRREIQNRDELDYVVVEQLQEMLRSRQTIPRPRRTPII